MSEKFKIEFEIGKSGEWNVAVREDGDAKVTYTQLTTEQILAKIGDLLIKWTQTKP